MARRDVDVLGPGEIAVIGWRQGAAVAGGGRCLDPYASDIRVGRLRHMYVHPEARGEGLGAALLARVLEGWETYFDLLRLRAANPDSGRFYECHGFEVVRGQPDCTHRLRRRTGRSDQ